MRKYIIFTLICFTLLSPAFVPVVIAQVVGEGSVGMQPTTGSLNPLGDTNTLEALLLNIIKVVINIAIPVASLAIVYIGFLFVKAQGNPGEIDKAKKALGWTLAGLAVLLGARAIVDIIQSTVTGLG